MVSAFGLRREYARHVAFVAVCILAPFLGIYVELGLLTAMDTYYEPPLTVIRIAMILLPTGVVTAIVWTVSNRWYRPGIARLSTITVSLLGLLTYLFVALIFTAPI